MRSLYVTNKLTAGNMGVPERFLGKSRDRSCEFRLSAISRGSVSRISRGHLTTVSLVGLPLRTSVFTRMTSDIAIDSACTLESM